MTESVIMRGQTRLTSTASERAAIHARARADALSRFGNDSENSILTILLDQLWQAENAMSRGYSRLEPKHEVRPAKEQHPDQALGAEIEGAEAVSFIAELPPEMRDASDIPQICFWSAQAVAPGLGPDGLRDLADAAAAKVHAASELGAA